MKENGKINIFSNPSFDELRLVTDVRYNQPTFRFSPLKWVVYYIVHPSPSEKYVIFSVVIKHLRCESIIIILFT